MGETIKQSELRNNNAEIMRRVAAGESFTVTVHGQPIADLVPHQRTGHRRRRLVPAVDFDAALAALAPVDVQQWKRDLQEADHVFGGDLPTDPWDEAGKRWLGTT
ncbi:MAG: type II toxin-antitoxin system Phd/YefM family antitoxin [Pseudonocardiaceae bacterium]